jgi:hypothetical protein
MQTTIHRPLKVEVFIANSTGKQTYNMALFSETHLKSHEVYDIYQTEHQDRHKRWFSIAVKRGIPHRCTGFPSLCSVEATGVCILGGNTEMLLAAVCKSP